MELRPLERLLLGHGYEFLAAASAVAISLAVFGHGSANSVEEEVALRGLVERLGLSSEVSAVVAAAIAADQLGGFGIVGFAFDDLFHNLVWLVFVWGDCCGG